MIVFRRRKHDQIMIGGNIIVTVMHIRGSRVSLGIQAPEGFKILRQELTPDKPMASLPVVENAEAMTTQLPVVN